MLKTVAYPVAAVSVAILFGSQIQADSTHFRARVNLIQTGPRMLPEPAAAAR